MRGNKWEETSEAENFFKKGKSIKLSLFFEKLNKFDKFLARLTKKNKREDSNYKSQEENIGHHYGPYRNGKLVTEYHKQLYSNKINNLDKMETFLETHKLPKLTEYKIENRN